MINSFCYNVDLESQFIPDIVSHIDECISQFIWCAILYGSNESPSFRWRVGVRSGIYHAYIQWASSYATMQMCSLSFKIMDRHFFDKTASGLARTTTLLPLISVYNKIVHQHSTMVYLVIYHWRSWIFIVERVYHMIDIKNGNHIKNLSIHFFAWPSFFVNNCTCHMHWCRVSIYGSSFYIVLIQVLYLILN